MFNRRNSTTFLIVTGMIGITILMLVGLPYGQLNWKALADSAGAYEPTATPPPPVDDVSPTPTPVVVADVPGVDYIPQDEVVDAGDEVIDTGSTTVTVTEDETLEVASGDEVVTLDPDTLREAAADYLAENADALSELIPAQRLVAAYSLGNGVTVELYLLAVPAENVLQLQVNIYQDGELVDDSLEIFLLADGSVLYRYRS